MTLSVVEISQLFEVVWVSLAAGIGLTITYSFVILGTARSSEARREKRSVAAFAYGAFATLFFLLFAGGMVLAVQIMLTKSG